MATGIPVPAGGLVGIDYLNEVARAHWRKTTAKQVVNTVVDTDLLNGEITINAGAMSLARGLRLTAFGDLVNNSGATRDAPRWKLKLGAATLIDSNALTGVWAAGATRYAWRMVAEILNTGAANAQWCSLLGDVTVPLAAAIAGGPAVGEGLHVAGPIISANGFIKILAEAAGAVDTTVAQVLALSVILPVANASLDVTLKGALVELI